MITSAQMETANWRRALAVRGGVILVAILACAAGEGTGVARLNAQQREFSFPHRPELKLGRTADYDYDPPAPGSYELPALQPAGDGKVLRLSGSQGRLREMLKGRITVLSFIYTRCADPRGCPYAMGVLYQVHAFTEQDPVVAKNLRLVTFSFDPQYDTPQVLANYTRALRKETGAEWLFLTTENNQDLAPLLEAYGQQVNKKSDPADPLGPYNHLLRVFLIDREGTIRNIYSTGMLDPRLVMTDVRTLLLEELDAERSIE